MDSQPDYYLDLPCGFTPSDGPADADIERAGPSGSRRWLGILFDCCGVYVRLYRRSSDNAYAGRCPRCGRQARVRIAPDGLKARFLRAY